MLEMIASSSRVQWFRDHSLLWLPLEGSKPTLPTENTLHTPPPPASEITCMDFSLFLKSSLWLTQTRAEYRKVLGAEAGGQKRIPTATLLVLGENVKWWPLVVQIFKGGQLMLPGV